MKFVSNVHIISYFSVPTDLATIMKDWPEFVDGKNYSVRLKSPGIKMVQVALSRRAVVNDL